jgi:tetratricopeptide (TPR) repeat protein
LRGAITDAVRAAARGRFTIECVAFEDVFEMNFVRGKLVRAILLCGVACAAATLGAARVARAAPLQLPPEATDGLKLLYSGQSGAARALFSRLEQEEPNDPLPYLLEADAHWWEIYCQACEIKWGFIDAWSRPKITDDDSYLALSTKAITLAQAAIAQHDTAEMELYAGMGYLLRARLLGLRDDRSGTAHAGVSARQHLLRCLELDPQMTDAYTGLGLYNYYVDTLSAMARVLRFFMGIPGGDKREGIRQLKIAMNDGPLTGVEARFYLAKNLRTYDFDYAQALDILTPLVREYPTNPTFALLMGNLEGELGHNESAAEYYRAATQQPPSDAACAAQVVKLAHDATAALPSAAH